MAMARMAGTATIRRSFVIGTRGSLLARAQCHIVRAKLAARYSDDAWLTKEIKTQGDIDRDVSLTFMGGQGVFVRALEESLLAGEIDLAVHSLKDMPTELPPGLRLAAILAREDTRDVLVSQASLSLDRLPKGAVVGTGSVRRQAQLLCYRPDLTVRDIRGNVDTRLRKLHDREYDALLLAAAGLLRLGRSQLITEFLPMEVMLPAVGQGALAIEVREDDRAVIRRIDPLNDHATERAVRAERGFLAALGGGCAVPVAAYGNVDRGRIRLTGLVADATGARCIRGSLTGPASQPETLGQRLVERLLNLGARELLQGAISG
jgi:hydroxymethylbilane synthase